MIMVRKYVMLAVLGSMVFFALGCKPRPTSTMPAEEKKSGRTTNDLWKGYGDVDTKPHPKYKNMPDLKK
jgi:hypothetical protein